MAANDAQQIEGGNFQIFEGMVANSGAEVKLETKIARVRRLEPRHQGEEPQFEVTTTTGHKQIFDYIVLAAPIVSFPDFFFVYFCLYLGCIARRVCDMYFSSESKTRNALLITHTL